MSVIYNVVDDEAPDIATLFAAVGAPPPDGANAEMARAFDALMDGRRIRADLGFAPQFPRLAGAIAAGALWRDAAPPFIIEQELRARSAQRRCQMRGDERVR